MIPILPELGTSGSAAVHSPRAGLVDLDSFTRFKTNKTALIFLNGDSGLFQDKLIKKTRG